MSDRYGVAGPGSIQQHLGELYNKAPQGYFATPEGTQLYADMNRLAQLKNEYNQATRAWQQARANSAVPSMPWQTTEEWTGLAARRIMAEAAEGGYDRVVWTPGAVQTERYESALRRRVGEIEWGPHRPTDGKNTVLVQAKDPEGGGTVFSNYIPLEGTARIQGQDVTLDEVVGPTIASRIRTQSSGGIVEGDELTIGGEGMKSFYDEIFPGALQRAANDMGVPVQVTQTPREAPGLGDPSSWRVTTEMMPDYASSSHESLTAVVRDAEGKPLWHYRVPPQNRYLWGVGDPPAGLGGGLDVDQAIIDSNRELAEQQIIDRAVRGIQDREATGIEGYRGINIAPETRERILREGQRLLAPAGIGLGGGLLFGLQDPANRQ